MKRTSFSLLLAGLILSGPAAAADCLMPASARFAEAMSTVAPEMAIAPVADVFCVSAGEALAKLRATSAAPGEYVPLTKYDNTPWRFDMSQNGKRMTAVEFDAWMKAKGIRIAKGRPAAAAEGAPAAPDATPPVEAGK